MNCHNQLWIYYHDHFSNYPLELKMPIACNESKVELLTLKNIEFIKKQILVIPL